MLEIIRRNEGEFIVQEGDFDENVYFMASVQERPYFYIHLQLIDNVGCVHAYPVNFSLEGRKAIQKDFTQILRILEIAGIQIVKGIKVIDEEISKWTKFVTMMGFTHITNINFEGRKCLLAEMEVRDGS